jgi:hypothetical protein
LTTSATVGKRIQDVSHPRLTQPPISRRSHRYRGTLFGMIGSIPLHVVEDASQIRQFITAAGVKAQPRDDTDPTG